MTSGWPTPASFTKNRTYLPGVSGPTSPSLRPVRIAKLANNCLLIISLPASDAGDATADVEVGGLRGRQAIASLRNVIGQIDSSWRPATAEESSEIVRRRLFQPIPTKPTSSSGITWPGAYCDLYRNNSQEFPSECGETAYEDRIKAATRYTRRSSRGSIPTGRRCKTSSGPRGVLRLMASVIHSLWDNGDRSPLIMPANILLDDPPVQSELNRYLPDNWPPVIERDIDGPNSCPPVSTERRPIWAGTALAAG